MKKPKNMSDISKLSQMKSRWWFRQNEMKNNDENMPQKAKILKVVYN